MLASTALLTSLILLVPGSIDAFVQAAPEPSTAALAVADAPNPASSLRFEPAILDLGELSVGQSGSGKVTVINTGDKPIRIARIVPACGCTKASAAPADDIQPGASFDVEITLDAGKRPGVELKRKVAFHVDGVGITAYELKASIRTDAAKHDGTPFVSLIRLTPATALAPGGRVFAERAQDAAILAIDSALEQAGAKDGIHMKLHRESGALFVHGTALQIEIAERTMGERALGS